MLFKSFIVFREKNFLTFFLLKKYSNLDVEQRQMLVVSSGCLGKLGEEVVQNGQIRVLGRGEGESDQRLEDRRGVHGRPEF